MLHVDVWRSELFFWAFDSVAIWAQGSALVHVRRRGCGGTAGSGSLPTARPCLFVLAIAGDPSIAHGSCGIASCKFEVAITHGRIEAGVQIAPVSDLDFKLAGDFTIHMFGSQAVRAPDSRRRASTSRVQEHSFVGREPASFLNERCASAGLPCWKLHEHRRVTEEDCYWQDTDRLSARGHIVGLVLLEVPGKRIRNTLGLVSEEHRLLWQSYPDEVRHELAGSLVCDARSHSHLHT
jgi:hypothetical protein